MRKYCWIAELLSLSLNTDDKICRFPIQRPDDFSTFQQDNAPAHRARETMQLLTCETPDFIAPALWPANSPDLNPVDYQIGGSCRSVCITVGFMTWTWSKRGNISTRCYQWSDQAVASTSSSLHSRTRRTFWTQTLIMFDICTGIHFDRNACAVAYSGHFCLGVISLNPL